jgi:hypothetical protein
LPFVFSAGNQQKLTSPHIEIDDYFGSVIERKSGKDSWPGSNPKAHFIF